MLRLGIYEQGFTWHAIAVTQLDPVAVWWFVLQVVAGALVEGDEEDEDASAPGNAGSWIKVELMLEEVRAQGRRGASTPSSPSLGCLQRNQWHTGCL